MLNSIVFGRQCSSLFRCLPLMCQSVATKSSFRPHSELLQDVNLKELQAKYSEIVDLKSASERVKNIFTLEYGGHDEITEKIIIDLIDSIVERDHCRFDTVSDIVKLTVRIKYMQEKYNGKPGKFQHYRKRLFYVVEERRKILDELRDSHFETYVKAIDALKIQHKFDPQYTIKASSLAKTVGDMRVRAFAESRRRIAASQEREIKLLNLKEKLKNDLMKQDVEVDSK